MATTNSPRKTLRGTHVLILAELPALSKITIVYFLLLSLMLCGHCGVLSEPCLGEGGLDCGDGSCVSEDARCDGFQDCQMTGKDEEDCGKSSDHATNTDDILNVKIFRDSNLLSKSFLLHSLTAGFLFPVMQLTSPAQTSTTAPTL